jgi:YegS/Rv2252/BmrU family lipid kinase
MEQKQEHVFIINPVAGKKESLKIFDKIVRVCDSKGIIPTVEFTEYAGHAEKIARTSALAHNNCRIYIAGGDGTVNEGACGIAGTNAILGVIPSGSGNDFHRMLSDDKDNIIARTIDGTIENIYLGKVNDKHFINIGSVGFDADVAAHVNASKRKNYLMSIFSTLMTYKCHNVKISLNGMAFEQKITLIVVCRGRYYGDGIPIGPDADINEERLDVYYADELSQLRILRLLGKAFKGEHVNSPFVHHYQTDHIKIETEKAINCNLDGEIIKSDTFDFSIGDSIKVLRPKKNH